MASKRPRYVVHYERDEDGWWVASVRRVRGCHTQGRTLAQAKERIREALGLYDEQASTAILEDEIEFPDSVKRVVTEYRKHRARIEREQREVQKCAKEAARTLTRRLGIGMRDAGEILGLSHQRVQQLVR